MRRASIFHNRSRGTAGDGTANGGASTVRVRFRFVGQVQAVGFRWNTCNFAREANATGWVRNEADGSVTTEIQGTPDQVNAVVDGLERYYNETSWSDGFQIAAKDYLPPISGEHSFRVAY